MALPVPSIHREKGDHEFASRHTIGFTRRASVATYVHQRTGDRRRRRRTRPVAILRVGADREWQAAECGSGVNWDNKGWVGRDRDRLWFRTEGQTGEGRLGDAQAHVLYGRAFARWWDVVAGVRQDFRPGPSRTWVAIGVQGLAPYWFEVEATAHIGAFGRTHMRLETEYELLLTNRLILQPLVEVELYGKSDPERGIGAGLSTADVGLRVRYEFRREFAPYLGLVWSRKFSGMADFSETAGEKVGRARLAVGLRLWL